jgi:hypothetical protein
VRRTLPSLVKPSDVGRARDGAYRLTSALEEPEQTSQTMAALSPPLLSADKEHYVKLIILAPDDTRRRSEVMRERQERKGRLWL